MDDFSEAVIPLNTFTHVLKGVVVATKAPDSCTRLLSDWLKDLETGSKKVCQWQDSDACSAAPEECALSVDTWRKRIHETSWTTESRQLIELTIAVALLRDTSRHQKGTPSEQIDQIWNIVYDVLTQPNESQLEFVATRGAQGFFAIPLCSLLENGSIKELIRFHVWLPDGERGLQAISTHAHQPFAESLILAGVAADHTYDSEAVQDIATATHAEYALEWRNGGKAGKEYSTHRPSSTIVNTGKLVRVSERRSRVHSRDKRYNVPAGVLHCSGVPARKFHATLFFFDAERGFVPDAGVVGPKDGTEYTAHRIPAAVTARALAKMANAVRSWEKGRPERSLWDEEDEEVLRLYCQIFAPV